MSKQTYLNLEYDEKIRDAFPRSVEAVIKWFCEREDIVQGLMGVGGEGATIEEVKEAFKQVVPIVIQHDPRKLYEFFDDQNIIISIAVHTDIPGRFVYFLTSDYHSFSTDSRIEAEKEAFMRAFDTLEKRLNSSL